MSRFCVRAALVKSEAVTAGLVGDASSGYGIVLVRCLRRVLSFLFSVYSSFVKSMSGLVSGVEGRLKV